MPNIKSAIKRVTVSEKKAAIDQAAAKGHMTKQAASRAKSKLAKAANAAK